MRFVSVRVNRSRARAAGYTDAEIDAAVASAREQAREYAAGEVNYLVSIDGVDYVVPGPVRRAIGAAWAWVVRTVKGWRAGR